MKTIVACLGLLALAAGLAAHADAATYKKKKRLYSSEYSKATNYRDQDDSPYGYYEHRLESVRFGSRRWWAIFDEQSGGSQHR
jgi:hypothetical protein